MGTALLLLTLLAAENLTNASGGPHGLTLRLAEIGFAVFAARALIATRPLGPWVRARPAPLRWLAYAAFAGILLLQSFWAAVAMLAVLLLFGGILAIEFLDDVATFAARPPALARRRPVAFAGALVGVLAPLALAHDILARGMYLVNAESPVSLAFGTATFALYGAVLVVLALLALAARGIGREALPRRALYAVVFLYLVGWLFGYQDGDALGALGPRGVPLLALGMGVVQFSEILFEAPDRLARRALPRHALWDLFLALSFAAVFLLSVFGLGGQAAARTLFEAKALLWVGFALGALLVPLARWRHARASASGP